MSLKINVKFDNKEINKVLSKLKSTKLVGAVGIFDDKENAIKLATNVFGSFIKNIPERDPLFKPIQERQDDIKNILTKNFLKQIEDSKTSNQAMKAALDKTLFYVLNSIVKNEILTNGQGKWKKLSPETIKRKDGSQQMLIHYKDMFNALTFKILKED